MSDRDNAALLLVMLLIALLLGCIEEGGYSSCSQLRMDCPGIVNDYIICNQASDLRQQRVDNQIKFSYYDCDMNITFGGLTAPAGCAPSF
jgi:hypothetical protein